MEVPASDSRMQEVRSLHSGPSFDSDMAEVSRLRRNDGQEQESGSAADILLTFVVLMLAVAGFSWTVFAGQRGLPSTSFLLYTFAKTHPGIVYAFGVMMGVVMKDWIRNHPYLTAFVAFCFGHMLWPTFPV